MNEIFAYDGEDFDLATAIADRKIPADHQERIRRELEKLYRFDYSDLLPPKKTLKGLGTLEDGTLLYELRPHCSNRTQYRLPLVSPEKPKFLILGFFRRRDADFKKQIKIVQARFQKILSKDATYVLIDFENFE